MQIAMIGNRQRIHSVSLGTLQQLVDRAGPVKQTVVAVAMQMREGTRSVC